MKVLGALSFSVAGGLGRARYAPAPGWRPISALLAGGVILAAAPWVALGAAWLFARLTGFGAEGLMQPGAIERLETLRETVYFATMHATILALAGLAAGLGAGWDARRAAETLALAAPPEGTRAYAAAVLITIAAATAWFGALWAVAPEVIAGEAGDYQARLKGEAGWLLLLVLGVLAPLAEEVLFRGLLFSALAQSKLGVAGAALLTTGIWTALHIDHSALGKAQVAALGLLMCWLLVRTGSLRVPIFCHILFNCGVSLALLLTPPLA